MDSPLSITSSVISILTFIVATLIWLGQHLDRAIKLDDEIATTALMLIRSCGETSEIQFISLKESTKLNYQLARMWTLDLESIDVLTLTGLGNATNEILEGKFNSLKATHQEPPKEALDFAPVLPWQRKERAEERRLQKKLSEELSKEALKEPLEEQHDGPSNRPMEELPRAHSVQAAEQAEEPSEIQSELQSELKSEESAGPSPRPLRTCLAGEATLRGC
ncbi:hypothetical protein V496_08045 [Pseudogymnoascus sp. VKM F-4515 (FW-2607)]|nr:hypothetical protein V496_08045 [Pseudogymnoascus sp. VKM F-4515 (FW-2607)]KFY81773.1 hypothetical protein V498_08695 [Pseudogymnoascus sp. VKM F-4517 (FW-2822)]